MFRKEKAEMMGKKKQLVLVYWWIAEFVDLMNIA